ncbi:NAD(P)-binding protein [Staphylococcus gallinarum]|uniref:precorrin-2 dehydrogenase n=1 Tax=Staphylococcus gallinarum TaxID=1293 RepID=A0A3A0VR70_STAGA|nr:NAD(P)-binding protein [Staphylococcus gallinarum]RIP34814.1 NAD(P)-binding protein [Staphylococcus gallinarum]
MPLIPLMFDISDKQVVVIGGGKVAERRVKTLAQYTKHILIISPTLTNVLEELFENSVIKWCKREFRAEDVQTASLIIVATNDSETNKRVLQAKPQHALINYAEDVAVGDIAFPSILQRGKLTLSVSTQGASPGLTAQILQEFRERYDLQYEVYVDFLYECRQRIKQSQLSVSERKQFLKDILSADYLNENKQIEVRTWLDSLT